VFGVTEGPKFRAALDDIPLYRAGKAAPAREDLVTFKLSSNENPYPPLPQVLEVIARASLDVNRYPDPGAKTLVDAISAYHGVPAEHVTVGTGAVALCYQVAQATAEAGDEIIYAWRSFEAYPIVTRVAGATAVPVSLTPDLCHDLDAMAEAITDRTRMIFLCSPNNPTGTVIRGGELINFLDRVPSDVLVVLDEAYFEFNRDQSVANGVELYRNYANVVVLRTFSKAYGLAGLRVGYAISHDPVIAALKKTAHPFGVSIVAEAAAIASLADDTELLKRVGELVWQRDTLTAGLRSQGWEVPDSQANFVWLATGSRSDEFALACDGAGLTVRAFGHDGVRVTVAEPEANQRLLEVAAAFPR
jgi:histidinol-phosphate aminotransferase